MEAVLEKPKNKKKKKEKPIPENVTSKVTQGTTEELLVEEHASGFVLEPIENQGCPSNDANQQSTNGNTISVEDVIADAISEKNNEDINETTDTQDELNEPIKTFEDISSDQSEDKENILTMAAETSSSSEDKENISVMAAETGSFKSETTKNPMNDPATAIADFKKILNLHEQIATNIKQNQENISMMAAETGSSESETTKNPLNDPVTVVANFEKILNLNKQIATNIKQNQESCSFQNIGKSVEQKLSPTDNCLKVDTVIRPYTESQLSALYRNSELEMLEQFISDFVEAELKGISIKRHHLYEMLANYLHVREKITEYNIELEQLRKEYGELQSSLWSCEKVLINGRGECQDGNIVVATHYYNKATFHRSVFQNIVRTLGNINKLIYEKHVFYMYAAEELRLQIEYYIQNVMADLMRVTMLSRNAPVTLVLHEEPVYLKPYLSEIRLSISILFAFQRKLIADEKFIKESREWLSRLIAVLLRLANYQDHLFILNHILRCPAGVSSWACSFIQAPLDINKLESPFASYEINHILTIFACILMPVRHRDTFLEDVAQVKESNGDMLFVVVDSEGEEDEEPSGTSLKENDLVALLNQLPIDNLFRALLLVERRNYKDSYEGSKVTEHHILRFLAFSTVLLRTIHRGLQTYNQPRYNQFSKRLCRFIRHVVQYATDQWEHFQKVQTLEDSAMLQRLQIEYDAFFLRAIYYLYSSQKLGAWQFLAVVPYNIVSIDCLWKIFYFLHDSDSSAGKILAPTDNTNYSDKIWLPSLRTEFQEKISSLEDVETYYLLNTFANMALARSEIDMPFIHCATIDLLQVGFINLPTQDTCSKSARILLTHITSKYPHLLSELLKEVKGNMDKIGSLALYLYEELPLSVWKLCDEDLMTISRLLLYPVTSDESKLARMIISRLNWDLDDSGKLFLPYGMHCDTALMVMEVVERESAYTHWAWQTILRLKLHISDKGFTEIGRVQDPGMLSAVSKGLREQQPLASFVAVLMTTVGHLVPVICSEGLQKLIFLQSCQRHEAVLFALYVIVPIFINCQECLINREHFQTILLNLLNADRGYISMAKSLISTQNTVLQQFGNMIETQIVTFKSYGIDSPRLLVRLWLNSLVSLPNWNRDGSVLYLIDVIVRSAFFHSSALEAVHSILRELIQASSPQEHSGTIGTLFKWVSNSNGSTSLICSSLSSYTWLAYVFLELEFDEKEKRTGFWRELLIQLNRQKGKVSVDNAIKKAATVVKTSSFSSASLGLYRIAQQAMDTPIDHPLLPLFWQKFFSLYLARIPISTTVDKSCVGDAFFEGVVNFSFLKKIKRHLQDVLAFYKQKCETNEGDEELPPSRKQFYNNCVRIFRAYMLWLEEPRLKESSLFLPSLPPHYEPGLLALIMQDNSTPWYEFLDYERIKEEQRNCVRTWRLSNFREKSNVNKPLLNPGSRLESPDPVERILKRLASYDTPKPPPNINSGEPVIGDIRFSSDEAMLTSLSPCFKTLKQFAHNHMLKISQHKALDCSYKELVPQLYRSALSQVTSRVPCKGKNQTVLCSGPAIIVLEMQEARVNEKISHQIQSNRNAYESLVTEVLQLPAMSLCTASVTIHLTLKIVQAKHRTPASAKLGVELFYHILSLVSEETSSYLPTKSLFSLCLERLGQSHIFAVEEETPRLLNKIITEPALGCYLAPHFSPKNASSPNLLTMYSRITQEIGKKFDIAFALLSKFEIENWLVQRQPKLCQRSQFIDHVIKALIALGFEPCVDSLMLHGLYRRHLLTVFEFQFPEHYGEVMIHLLKASNGTSESNLLAVTVWVDVLNSLARPMEIHNKIPLRDQLRQYAQHQTMLQHQELLETAELLAKHFTQERLQYGLYGLYPKCRNYMEVFSFLLGMTGHALIISSLNTHQGILGDKMCEKIWPHLREMFAPWLVPYSMQHSREEMASWIQQLADDRSVLLPWISADIAHAQRILEVFFECVQFIIQVLPACGNILSFVWQWYVNCFASTLVKEHILNPVHHALMLLPWISFWPTITDLECMLRVVDQYLPECHSFLGFVFMQISWSNWLHNFDHSPTHVKCRVYQCFLNLLVKLSNEPNVRGKHSEKAKSLLVQAENFDWEVLDSSVYQHVTDWYVLSCDPFVIFKTDPLDLDFRVLHFMRCVSGYDKPPPTSPSQNMMKKRSMFLRMHVKLVSVFASKYKTTIPSKEYELSAVISFQLNHLDGVVQTEEELLLLIVELLYLLNVTSIGCITLKCFNKWIAKKPGDGMLIRVLLQTISIAVSDPYMVSDLYENTLTSYFQNNVNGAFEPSWRQVADYLKVVPFKQADLEESLIDNGKVLTLTAIVVQKINKGTDSEILLNLCLEWLTRLKISEQIETKVTMLWLVVLHLAYKHCAVDETCAATVLYDFVQILLETSDDRRNSTGWGRGLLNAIGIAKPGILSTNFRFLCRALACYVLAQLPVMKGGPQLVRHVANAPARVGEPGGNTECSKILLKLDFGQSQGKIKDCAELALNQIQDSNNSLHSAGKFLILLLKQFYVKPYLKEIT